MKKLEIASPLCITTSSLSYLEIKNYFPILIPQS